MFVEFGDNLFIFFVAIKPMLYHFFHKYIRIGMILLNDIMKWININVLLVELTFVVHLKMHFLVFLFIQMFKFFHIYICPIGFAYLVSQIYLLLLNKKCNKLLLCMDLK